MVDNTLAIAKDNNYALTIQHLDHLVYNCTRTGIPGITVAKADVETPTLNFPQPGSKLIYEPLVATFFVDEDYENWEAVFKEMVGYQTGDTEKFDCSLIITNNHGKKGKSINFRDAFILGFDTLEFTSETSKATEIRCTLTINYSHYESQAN